MLAATARVVKVRVGRTNLETLERITASGIWRSCSHCVDAAAAAAACLGDREEKSSGSGGGFREGGKNCTGADIPRELLALPAKAKKSLHARGRKSIDAPVNTVRPSAPGSMHSRFVPPDNGPANM